MKALLTLQSLFYFVTGLWPLIHMESFLFVTGPKEDLWLVNIVGALIGISGIGFYLESRAHKLNPGILFMAPAMAVALATVDFVYVFQKIIHPIYLWDAVAETAVATLWLGLIYKNRKLLLQEST